MEQAAKKLMDGLSDCQLRLHCTRDSALALDPDYNYKITDIYFKPIGIWYGFGMSWFDFCLKESFGGIGPYIYEIILDESKILKINNIEDFESFENEYTIQDPFMKSLGIKLSSRMLHRIDWPRLRNEYSGIEINPYLWEKRLESMWYYPWDCASGCVWDFSVAQTKKFAYYNKEAKIYDLEVRHD